MFAAKAILQTGRAEFAASSLLLHNEGSNFDTLSVRQWHIHEVAKTLPPVMAGSAIKRPQLNIWRKINGNYGFTCGIRLVNRVCHPRRLRHHGDWDYQ